MLNGIDSNLIAVEDPRGNLGFVQRRSEVSYVFFIPVHLLCASLLVPVYLAILVRCFVIADAGVPQHSIRKPSRRKLPDPDDPNLVIALPTKGGKKSDTSNVIKLTFRQRLRLFVSGLYFSLGSVVMVLVSSNVF